MKPLPAALDEYLALRRSLGYKLCEEGSLLRQFLAFAGERGAEFITTDLALTWATRQPAEYSPQWCRRLRVVRHFAQYCSAHDPQTVVPPPGLLLHRYQRPTPYIYRDEEIGRLLASAAELPSKTGLRPRTFVTLFGLYAVTGLRCQEPLQLDRTDVDWQNGVLTIRGTKFGKSRWLRCTRVQSTPCAPMRSAAIACAATRTARASSSRRQALACRTGRYARLS